MFYGLHASLLTLDCEVGAISADTNTLVRTGALLHDRHYILIVDFVLHAYPLRAKPDAST